MGQNKVNERIAMMMLRQCALVWEYCTLLTKPATELECKFADIYKGVCGSASQDNAISGPICVGMELCRYPDVFAKKMLEIEGVVDYTPDGQHPTVKMLFQTSDTDPGCGFDCTYPIEMVFKVTYNFCHNNGCPGLLGKTVFGMDDTGKYARLPQVSVTRKLAKKTAVKVNVKNLKPQIKSEPTMADRLREALLRQLKQAA